MTYVDIIQGLGILLLNPLIIFLLTLQKKPSFFQILISSLIGEYILSVNILVLGLLKFFDYRIILLSSTLTASLIGIIIRKKIKITTSPLHLSTIIISIFFCFFILIIQEYTFPSGYSLIAEYPWARIIVREGAIPAFHGIYSFEKPPFFYTHIALLFSSQGNFEISITRSMPLFYTFLFISLLINWSREKDINSPFFVLIPLFGIWPLFIQTSSWAVNEIPLLFFVTSSLYLQFNYLKHKEDRYLILLGISLSLGMLTDITAYLLSFLIGITVILKSQKKKKTLVYISVFCLPIFLWILRNYYFFNTTPLNYVIGMTRYFIKSVSTIMPPNTSSTIQNTDTLYYFNVLKDVLATYPAFFLGIGYIYKNRHNFDTKFVLLVFLIYSFYLRDVGKAYGHGGEFLRYMFLFFGIFALYAGSELSTLYDLVPSRVLRENKMAISVILFILLLSYSFARISIYYTHIDKYDYNAQKGVLQYLSQNKEEDEALRIFGEFSPVLIWYGDVELIFVPESIKLLIPKEYSTFKYDEDSIYYYKLLTKIDTDYVYDTPTYDYFDIIFMKISKDERHFKLVYHDRRGYKLWRII